ncbi:MAG: TonB-dependent receptor, partial [Gammaproteobacteria bacterium]
MSNNHYLPISFVALAAVGFFGLLGGQSASAQGVSALLEEVIVTARRREESLQDLPLSIAAISADQIEAQGILSIEDASDFVPNVTLTQSDRQNNTRIVIRGIGGGHPDPVFVFGSGMYIDGHYIPNSLGGYMSTMDIERVELLRGPQGTLFGKNVTGGAVNIVTAKPGADFDAKLTLRTADDGQADLRGMVNIPLGDTVFARVAVASESYDGHYYNRNLKKDVGAKDRSSYNVALRFQPNDNWTVDFSVNSIQRRDDNMPISCDPKDGSAPAWGGKSSKWKSYVDGRLNHLDRGYYRDAGVAPTMGGYGTTAADDGTGMVKDHRAACAADIAAGDYITSADMSTFSDLDVDSFFTTVQWGSNGAIGGLDDLNMKFRYSSRETDYDYQQDRDGSFYDIDNIGMPTWATSTGGDVGQDNDTEGYELLFEGQASDQLSFTVGYNWFYELARNGDGACRDAFEASGFAAVTSVEDKPTPTNGNADGSSGVDCTDKISALYFDLLPGWFLPFANSSRIENESHAFFAHLTYDINDDWTVDVGARNTTDDRNFWNLESAIDGCKIEEQLNPAAGLTGARSDVQYRKLGEGHSITDSGMCAYTYNVTFASAILDGFYNSATDSFSATTPMLSLTRRLGGGGALDEGMVYVLYSEGFLTGGFNTEVNSQLPQIKNFLSYDPESVSNIEFGFKGTFNNGRLRLNADYFMMDYQDKQESINVANPDALYGIDETLGIVTNVASVDISGIEFELRANVWDGGILSLDIGTLSNEYDAFKYADPEVSGSFIDESNT